MATYIDKSGAGLLAKERIPIVPTLMVIDTLYHHGEYLDSEKKLKLKN